MKKEALPNVFNDLKYAGTSPFSHFSIYAGKPQAPSRIEGRTESGVPCPQLAGMTAEREKTILTRRDQYRFWHRSFAGAQDDNGREDGGKLVARWRTAGMNVEGKMDSRLRMSGMTEGRRVSMRGCGWAQILRCCSG
jgi:hypothetical protein